MPKRALLFPPSVLVVLAAMVSTAASAASVAAFAFQPTLVPSQAGPLDVTLENVAAGNSPTQVPSAANSTCPTTASVGPRGTCCFDVIVRDALNNPIAGATTAIDFGGCPPSTLCPSQPPGVQTFGNTVVATTDAAGLAHFCVCVTSPVPLCNVTVSAEGVQLCSIALSSCEGSPADSCSTAGWRDLTVSGPGQRTGSAMVRHVTRGSLFLFGGSTGSGEPADTWEWDGEVWTHQTTGPMWGRRDHGMAYDRARDRVVLFGGAVSGAYVQETWEWSAASGWQLLSSSGPSPRARHAMAYDENVGMVMLFGGQSQAGVESDTWAWDGTSWALVSTTGPPARMSAAMANDPERKRIVLFGGSSTFAVSSVLADTWEWDGTQWTDVTVPGGPAPRRGHAMAFAPPSSRTILYGGEVATGAADGTTWSWNGFGWRAEPSGPPTISPVLAYDYTRGLITAFGGSTINGLSAITSQLCCLCDDEAIETDVAGEPIMPPGWDPLEPVIDEIVEEDLGDIATLYPTHNTSADTWLKDYPCPTAVGGTIPPDAFEPSVDDSLVALGIDAPGQAIVDSLASWESQLAEMFGSEPDTLGFLPPIGAAYVPPAQVWCPPDSGLFVFGGRDIVFVHGLMLDHVFDRLLGNPGAKENWRYATATESARTLNPEFYDTGGYYREIAEANWNEHISAFLDARGIKNRYVIVTYSCSQRLEIGIHSVLSQIHDAMGPDAVNVVDPTHTTTQGFGTPSFVIVSHSTGGLMAAAAMHAARTYPTLQAGHIAARCKAHVALASAFSGSRLATAALVLTGALGTLEPEWLCPLVRWAKEQEGGTVPACPFIIGTFFRSVLIDLVPSVAQLKWSSAVNDAGVKTVTLNGGHPTHLWPLKNLLHPGYDDGVVTINSASSNPNPNPLWPSGFIANWGPLGVRRTYDMGMAYFDGVRFRAKRYFQDARLDPSPFTLARLIPYYVAAGPIPYLSPTGMLQSVGLEFPDVTGFNPMRGRTGYYSFMTSAGEHPGIRSGANHPDYKPTYGVFSNVEEARVIREEDLPGMQERYAMVHPLDDQPIVKEGCEPDVYESVVGRRLNFKIRVFNNKPYPKRGWIWKRHYFRPAGVLTKHISDYGYDSILACEPIAPWCDATVNVAEPDRLGARATTLPNPSFGHVTFSFVVPRTSYAALTIYDLRGRTVRQLLGRELVAGPHREDWNGLDDRGMRVAAGVYFWKLRTSGLETTQRLVIVR